MNCADDGTFTSKSSNRWIRECEFFDEWVYARATATPQNHSAHLMPHPPAFPQPSPQKPDKDPGLPTYDGNGDASEFFTTVEEIFEAKVVSAQG